ncbi:hypothetical protein [Providencia hangzhouensis]|uniref:hypothetical protein n=1 Tax=Providencia hangzhouensis TaxID=3031799 RepID=UPI0034DD3D8B
MLTKITHVTRVIWRELSFLNATGRTLSGLLGIAFGKPVKISVSGGVEYLETDIDGQGQPLTQMIRDALSQNLQRGRGPIKRF